MAYFNCLFFDADGTLLDFDASQRKAVAEALDEAGLPSDDETVSAYCNINYELWAAFERGEFKKERIFRERFVRLGQKLGVKLDPDALNKSYEHLLSQHCDLMPDALEVLRELSEVATLAILSNGTEKVQSARLEASGIAQYMDAVFVSERVGSSKPNRKIFDQALDMLGVENPDKVLVIGDSLKADVEGGKNAGLSVCYFDNGLQKGQPRVKPDFTITSLKELYNIVMEPEEQAEIGNRNRKHML